MLTIQLLESEALQTLDRLTKITVPEKITEPISERLKRDTQKRYWEVWGQSPDKPYNVYTALKKVAFGKIKRGQLTGSTFNAIDNFYGVNYAGVGLNAFSWPTGSGKVKAPVQDVLDELNNIGYFSGESSFETTWNEFAGVATKPFKFRYKRHSGQVAISWTTFGLSIKWPQSVKYIFRDMFHPAEPFEVKRYNKQRWTINKFFDLNNDTINWAFNAIRAYIFTEYLYHKTKPSNINVGGLISSGLSADIDVIDRMQHTAVTEGAFAELFRKATRKTTKDVMDWVKTLQQKSAEQVLRTIIGGQR